MKKFSRWLTAKLIKDHQNSHDPEVRARYGALEGWTSIIINGLLFTVKLILGLSLRSVALIADAVHTLSDSISSVVVIIGFKAAKKPSDKEHPFGHGRMEPIATLIVAILLFMVAFEFLQRAVHNIIHPTIATASRGVILVIVLTLLIKELMARFAYQLGDMINSSTLKADAFHHRSDAITTVFVVLALVASRFNYPRLDGLMGVAVALIMGYCAYSLAKEAVTPLLGGAPPKEKIKEIEGLARRHQGVLGVHDIIFHQYGMTTITSLHIEVNDKAPAFKLHELAEAVEEAIAKELGGIVTVHIDPINKEHPQYEAIARVLGEIIAEEARVHSFHELRIVGADPHKCNVLFDIALEEEVPEKEGHNIIRSIEEKFQARFPAMKTIIKAEPKFVYNL